MHRPMDPFDGMCDRVHDGCRDGEEEHVGVAEAEAELTQEGEVVDGDA